MFKLPVCPYCSTVYTYGEVKKSIGKKSKECYHCKNSFRPKLSKKTVVFGVLFLILIISFNIVILRLLGDRNSSIMPLFFIDVIPVIAFYFLLPFTVSFIKIKGNKVKEIPNDSILPEKTKRKRSEKARKKKELNKNR